MIVHNKITKKKAKELGYSHNFTWAIKDGIDVCQYKVGSPLTHFVITEKISDGLVKIMLMKADEAMKYRCKKRTEEK